MLIVVIFACNGRNKPNKVAKAFLTTLYSMEYDSAKTYCTPESYGYIEYLKLLDNFTNTTEEKPNKNINIDIIDTKVSGDNAECKYKITGIQEDENKEQTINLIKKDGKWLIDLHAENMDFNKGMPMNDTIPDKKDSVPME